jgi:transcriptional regulator with XRE-family HTH domain
MKRPPDTVAARLELYEALARGELTLGQTCRRFRKVIGKTQEEYAALAKVAPRVLKDLERGVGNPTLRTLKRIGKPFGLEVVYLRKPNKVET